MEPLTVRLGNEVRHGLHNILGLIGLIGEDPISESQRQCLTQCREAVDRLIRTSDDLGELARADGSVTGCASFDVPEAIDEIADLMCAFAKRNGLILTWEVGLEVPSRVFGDRYLLQDMLRRLMENAIRFTPSGSIWLYVGCSAGRGWNSILLVEISDTGTGIPSQTGRAFDTTDKHSKTRGLSLRVLRKRLERLGGTISFEQNVPHGTTVRATLPVELISSTLYEPSVYFNGASVPRVRLLVAEDSDDSYFLFTSYVKTKGYHVSRALNGEQALQMAKSGDYDFVVMDVNMPGLDGYRATRLIRDWETEQGRAPLPIVLLSADDLPRQLRMGGLAGCSGHLTKPTTKAQVLEALDYYLEHPTASFSQNSVAAKEFGSNSING